MLSSITKAVEPIESDWDDFGQKRMQPNDDNVIRETVRDFFSESSSSLDQVKHIGRRKKYAALFQLINDNAGEPHMLKYDSRDGAIVAQVGDEGAHCLVESSSSSQGISHLQSVCSTPDEMSMDGSQPRLALSRYAKAKMKAEREGRLDQFLAKNRARVARQRHEQDEEEKKAISKYEYARRKMNIETLRLTNPEEAEKLDEKRRASIRATSKKHYYANLEKERARNRQKSQALKMKMMEEMGALPNEIYDSSNGVVRDFDLNEVAVNDEEDQEYVE